MNGMLIEEIEKLDRNFLTPAEVSKALGISIATFYRSELDKRLLPGTKIAVLGYHTDKDEDGNPADRIVAKTLNY